MLDHGSPYETTFAETYFLLRSGISRGRSQCNKFLCVRLTRNNKSFRKIYRGYCVPVRTKEEHGKQRPELTSFVKINIERL